MLLGEIQQQHQHPVPAPRGAARHQDAALRRFSRGDQQLEGGLFDWLRFSHVTVACIPGIPSVPDPELLDKNPDPARDFAHWTKSCIEKFYNKINRIDLGR